MCGICGWVVQQGRPPAPELLGRMLARLHHRGPDQQDSAIFQRAALGIARLSINDVEGGRQPYHNEDNSVTAVFNGEIYNFRELRQDLETRGHQFRSQTDGEVIVHLYEEWGPRFVEKLNGMFAIALWDGDRFYLYRDRLGIKPVYYTTVAGVFYFASELKALLEIPELPRRLDRRALRSYLSMEYVPAPHSIFSGINKLRQAHYLRLHSNQSTIESYWNFPSFQPRTGPIQDWADRLEGLLRDAVRLRLVADVPVGVFLSGGLDSSTLTALMCELHAGPVHTFSVGFSDKSFDESSFSRQVSAQLGTVHHERILDSQSALAVLPRLYQGLDEPMADPALIPTFLLSQFARERVTVALSGEGADELLGGYPTYFAHQMARGFERLPPWLLQILNQAVQRLKTSRGHLSLDFKLKRFFSGLGRPDLERHLTWMGAMDWSASHDLLLDAAEPSFRTDDYVFPNSLVERAQTLDFHTYLADDLLVKLDRASMMVSLEGRVPFLDHRLVEAMAGLPTSHKLRFLDAKRVLKVAMGARLPDSVVRRKKKGFGIPIADWLRGPLKPLMEHHLSCAHLQRQGLFRPAVVERWVSEHLGGRADHRKPLWTLLVFQQWFEEYRPSL